MSTSCIIGIDKGDQFESIRCHWDGYPRGELGVGQMLKKYYTDPIIIDQLMKMGNLSSLGRCPEEDPNGWDLHASINNADSHALCVSYKARGDKGEESYSCANEEGFLEHALHSDIEYIYLFRDNRWLIYSSKKRQFIPY